MKAEELEEVAPVDGQLSENGTLLFIEGAYGHIVALKHMPELLRHGLRVRFRAPHVVPENINVISVATAVDLHGLQKIDELSQAGLSVYADDIGESHGARLQILKAHGE